jgi:hypothetical protein
MKFTIITPTTGNPKLAKLIQSINAQNENNDTPRTIEHYVVIDGPKFTAKATEILKANPARNHERFIFQLPFNTAIDINGGGNFLGHRIYASIGQLVRGDWVLLADDDNWYEPNHIDSFIQIINKYQTAQTAQIQWLYCLRKIENEAQGYVCCDNCESLGHLNPVFYNNADRLIDTNCYCIRRDLMLACSFIWNLKGTNDATNPDRVFSKKLMTEYPYFECTQQYSLNYYTGNRNTSVKSDLFVKGNELVLKRYGDFPWQRPLLYIAHFDRLHTNMVLKRVYGGNDHTQPLPSVAFHKWNLNFFDILSKKFLLVSAYEQPEYVAARSKLLFNMSSLVELPIKLIERSDIEKIVYTYESPNIQHQQQWDLACLLPKFNTILTYWKPMIDIAGYVANSIRYLPYIGRFDMTNPNDMAFITNNSHDHKKICIISENRKQNGEYIVNGITIRSQDYLRREYAIALGKRIDCYGPTWESMSDTINYYSTKNSESIIDVLKNYTFCLIIENCNADGYVSIKLYDAFTVGCIPLYYGNSNRMIGIPDDCFIDLNEMDITPDNLVELIDNMSMHTVKAYRKTIEEQRSHILEKVSINAYTQIIESVLKG